MNDAQDAVRAHVRDMQPVIEQVREMARMLEALANVQSELSNATQRNIAVDKASAALNEYMDDVRRRGAMLDRDVRSRLDLAQRELDAAKNGSLTDLNEIREKIHHNTIHPLQRRALFMARQVENITRTYEVLASQLRAAEAQSMGSLERLATDPEKP